VIVFGVRRVQVLRFISTGENESIFSKPSKTSEQALKLAKPTPCTITSWHIDEQGLEFRVGCYIEDR
jgi:hypothetical protein